MRMLDKKQAAEYLGVTTRTLERHAKEGKLSVRYEQSQFGEIAMFDPEELENFREGKQTTRIKPTIEPDQPKQIDRPSNPQSQIARSPQTELFNPQQPESNFIITALMGIPTLLLISLHWYQQSRRARENPGIDLEKHP